MPMTEPMHRPGTDLDTHDRAVQITLEGKQAAPLTNGVTCRIAWAMHETAPGRDDYHVTLASTITGQQIKARKYKHYRGRYQPWPWHSVDWIGDISELCLQMHLKHHVGHTWDVDDAIIRVPDSSPQDLMREQRRDEAARVRRRRYRRKVARDKGKAPEQVRQHEIDDEIFQPNHPHK